MASFRLTRWMVMFTCVMMMTQLPLHASAAFVPNNYYRMIAAALARRQKLSAENAVVKHHRTLTDSDEESNARDPTASGDLGKPDADPVESWPNFDAPDNRRKRLMGLFRCSGWGPSCTGGSGSGYGSAGYSTGFNSPADKMQQQQLHQPSRRRKHQRSYDQLQKKPPQPTSTASAMSGTERTTPPIGGSHNRGSNGRRQTAKFEPFFALTSGGSWGPARVLKSMLLVDLGVLPAGVES